LADESKIAAIVMIGFSASHDFDITKINPWNEELVPLLREIFHGGKTPMFMAVHKEQWKEHTKPTKILMQEMDSAGVCYVFDDVDQFINQILNKPSPFIFDYSWHWKKYFNFARTNYLMDTEYKINYV
jgi:hypothetical protein